MISNKGRDMFFLGVLVIVGLIASCSNPVKDEQKEKEKIYQDSLAQAAIDDEIIGNYLDAHGYRDDVDTTDYEVRYVVTKSGNGVSPKVNDIVSIDYIGKLADGRIFDTSIKQIAITNDSAAWVDAGVDVSGLMMETGQSIELVIDSLQYYDATVDDGIFSALRNYQPITYNHTISGNGISSNYVIGFKEGLHLLTPLMENGGESMTIFPSAVGYGTVANNRIPANSVLIFEFLMVNIRP